METNRYYRFEQGSYALLKRIPSKYMKSNEEYIIRRSLKGFVSKAFYYHIENNKQELVKLTSYINSRLNIYLQLKGKVEVSDIIQYINVICFEYMEKAKIENSSLEMKRIEALEYIDEHGVQEGYTLQAISKKYKEIYTQYNNLSDKAKTLELGSEIVQRSNISKEQILSIKPENIYTFYEMLIKAEKNVLENDIKLFVSRNLFKFNSLISDFGKSDSQKAEEVFYKYLELVSNNEYKPNYLAFVQAQKQELASVALNMDEISQNIFKAIQNKENDNKVSSSLRTDNLIESFISYKKNAPKKEKFHRGALKYFQDFLRGSNGGRYIHRLSENISETKEYAAKDLFDLTAEDFSDFELLMCEATVKNKSTSDNTLWDMIDLRYTFGDSRYAVSTMSAYQDSIHSFWRWIAKFRKDIKIDRDIIDVFKPTKLLRILKEDNDEEDPDLRAFTYEEINYFIQNTYTRIELKKILISSPYNFYIFLFALLIGCRLRETGLAAMNDIKVQEVDGVNHYYIYLNANQPYQNLKNANAYRNIPIPDLLIELGFLNYVHKRHKFNAETLYQLSPKSGAEGFGSFYKRHIAKLFPNNADTRENRRLGEMKTFVQLRSLRKNFSTFLFNENRTSFDTEINKKKIFGHESEGATSGYYERLEPSISSTIINAIDFQEKINFSEIRDIVSEFYGEIITELPWLKEIKEEWRIKGKIKSSKGRKI